MMHTVATPPSEPVLSTTPRPAMAFLMASRLSSYPDAHWPDGLWTLLADAQCAAACAAVDPDSWPRLYQHLDAVLTSAEALDRLRAEYIATFDHGRVHHSLYETEYSRDRALVKGQALADIAGFYRAFGLAFGQEDGAHEMLDHVAVELEFYALLLLKQEALAVRGDAEGEAIVFEARQKFLEAHLGRFVGAIAAAPGVLTSAFYGPVLTWCRDLVASECARLGLTPAPVEADQPWAEPEAMSCGGNCAVIDHQPGAMGAVGKSPV